MQSRKSEIQNEKSEVFDEHKNDLTLQVREVAVLLGISRSRVIQIEQKAIEKISRLLLSKGINSIGSLEDKVLNLDKQMNEPEESLAVRYLDGKSSWRTWLTVSRIISLNGGSENPWDITRAFAFLRGQRKNEKLPWPQIFETSNRNLKEIAKVNGMRVINNSLNVCMRSLSCNNLDNQNYLKATMLIIVESEFGEDNIGEFDIPIIKCAILSQKKI
jgi:hypothetical protein